MLTRRSLWLCCTCGFAIVRAVDGQPAREILISTEHQSAAELRMAATGDIVIIHRSNPVPLPVAGEHWVVVIDRDGRELFRRAPATDVPGAKVVSVNDAGAAKGRLVVSVTAINADEQMASLLLQYDVAARSLSRTVRTNPISCRRVTIGESGDTWCIGGNFERFNRRDHGYDVVYRYHSSGPLLHSFLPRSSLPQSPKNPVRPAEMGDPLVTAYARRVSAWLPGIETMANWTESSERVTLTEIPVIQAANRSTEVVALEDGRIVALRPVNTIGTDRSLWRRGFFMIGSASGSWLQVGLAEMRFGSSLIGVDRDGLVLWDRPAGRLRWLPLTR